MDIGLRELNWPQRTAQVSNAYSNQTELPTLSYALTILAYFTRHAGTVFVIADHHRAVEPRAMRTPARRKGTLPDLDILHHLALAAYFAGRLPGRVSRKNCPTVCSYVCDR